MDKLKQLFDLQHFEQNNSLEELIQETKSRYPQAFEDKKSGNIVSFRTPEKRALADDELEFLAAGIRRRGEDPDKKCWNCGTTVPGGKLICPHCGEAL